MREAKHLLGQNFSDIKDFIGKFYPGCGVQMYFQMQKSGTTVFRQMFF